MTEQTQVQGRKPPYGTVVIAHAVMALVYAATVSPLEGAPLLDRVADGFGFLVPALIVGLVMARSATKNDNPRPARAGITGVVVVAGLIIGFFWVG